MIPDRHTPFGLPSLKSIETLAFVAKAFAIISVAAIVCLANPKERLKGCPDLKAQTPERDELPELKRFERGVDQPIYQLGSGEAHRYGLKLQANQYFRVQGYFSGLDGAMTLYGPDGEKLEEVLLPKSTDGQKSLMWTSRVAGVYRFEVRGLEALPAKGKYRLQLYVWDANRENEGLIAADRNYFEAFRLYSIGTEEALRQAILKFQAAVSYWHPLQDLDSKYMEFESLMTIGEIYFNLSEYEKSLAPYQQALAMYEIPGWITHVNWPFNNLARSYEMLGDTEQALKYFQLSLRETEEYEPENFREQGIAHTALGAFYLNSGEKEKALEYLNNALPYWRKAGPYVTETTDIAGEARVYLRLGQLHASLGETSEAVDYFQKAAKAWRTTSDLVWLPRALNALGQTQYALNDFQGALESFNEALRISKQSGNRENQGYALANVGQVTSSLGASDEALDYLKQAQLLMQAIGNRGGEAYVLSRLGLLTRAKGNSREAIDYLNRALELRDTVRDREGMAEALYELAVTCRDLGDLETAKADIERALKLIEFVRTSFSGQEMRSQYLSNARSYYEFNVDLLMRLHDRNPSSGYDVKAFEASEQARARNLLETLFSSGVDIRQGVSDELLERERTIEQRLKAKSEYQTRLLSSSRAPEQAAQTAKEVEDLTDEYRAIQARVRAASPRYAELTQPRPLTLNEIQSQVVDDDTILLEYSLGEKRSFLWLVTRDSTSSFQLPKRGEIELLARRFYLNVSSPDTESDDLKKTSLALSRMLLGPIAGRLERKRLLIVAEGALQYVPFAALSNPQASKTANAMGALVTQHEIVSLPSASSLALLRHEIGSRDSAPKTVATLADPVFESNDTRVRQTRRAEATTKSEGTRTLVRINFDHSLRDAGLSANGVIQRLPSTRREAIAISRLVPAQQQKLALDFDASRTTVFNGDLNQYRILHFATHGLLDSQRPELSGLVLSLVDQNGRQQDGFLQVHEIYNLKLPADLVVLSACRTALGKDVKGEGLLGVTRGFMYAGAARVVSSLWEVDSRATAVLMTRFYREMLTNKLSPAAALRAAQISRSHDPSWHSPYYWAGFTIQGEFK
ncbi:MAG TPA: DUF2225 domain-containing protein [Pyrinomonadaceae bacterium]|jgi:CHAT domain-containing protein/Flp pilus assembly protein TadD|nr:DUF2225 domain-containing protein [Pyrinomonadaceae bacterium]